MEEAVTDERVGLFTPDKDGYTHTSRGRVAVIAARRGTVCGEVGRVPGFPQLSIHTLYMHFWVGRGEFFSNANFVLLLAGGLFGQKN